MPTNTAPRDCPIHLIGVEFSRERRAVVGFDVETLGWKRLQSPWIWTRPVAVGGQGTLVFAPFCGPRFLWGGLN
jgi:hypothetical protein